MNNQKQTYWEADVRCKPKPNANTCYFNQTTISFAGKPTEAEVVAEFGQRYPKMDFVEIVRLWDATGKSEALVAHYKQNRYHGD